MDAYGKGRLDGLRAALAALALIAMLGLFSARRIPKRPVGSPSPSP